MFGDPSVAASAYGVPGNGAGFGLASGGLPPEGMLYGPAPVGVRTMVVAGLMPNVPYMVSASNGTVNITPISNGAITDGAGVLRITF